MAPVVPVPPVAPVLPAVVPDPDPPLAEPWDVPDEAALVPVSPPDAVPVDVVPPDAVPVPPVVPLGPLSEPLQPTIKRATAGQASVRMG